MLPGSICMAPFAYGHTREPSTRAHACACAATGGEPDAFGGMFQGSGGAVAARRQGGRKSLPPLAPAPAAPPKEAGIWGAVHLASNSSGAGAFMSEQSLCMREPEAPANAMHGVQHTVC